MFSYRRGSCSVNRGRDGYQNTSDDVTLTGVIESGHYIVISHGKGWLNDGGDTVTLIASPSAEVDRVTYSSLADGKSFARIPDDSENWSAEADQTQGAANPTPTPSPSQSPSPVPEQSPIQSPSPHPPAPSPVSSPVPSVRPTPSPVYSAKPMGSIAGIATEAAEIDLSSFGISPSPSPSPSPRSELRVNKERARSVLLIGCGLIIISGASYAAYTRQRKDKLHDL